MTWVGNTTRFAGRTVRAFDPALKLSELASTAFRIALDYDAFARGESLHTQLDTMARDPRASRLEALVIGPWDFSATRDSSTVLNTLVAHRETFSSLRALFVGDISYEEQEMSWITHGDFEPVLQAFPALETLRIRGGVGMRLGALKHDALQSLEIESAGLPRAVVQSIASSDLPSLRTLEIWTGNPFAGGDSTLDDILPLLDSHRFAKRTRLAIRNNAWLDELAWTLSTFSSLGHVTELDLSLGTLSDRGAGFLLQSPAIQQLQCLDLHHHYLSPSMQNTLRRALGPRMALDLEQPMYAGDHAPASSFVVGVAE